MDIKNEIQVNASVKTIYDALSTQKGIEGWWAKNCTISTKVGEVSRIVFHPQGVPFDMHFRIEDLEENKRVLWSCVHNSNLAWLTTKISFDISGDDKTGNVVFNQFDSPRDYDSKMEAGTWNSFMNSLKNYCETGKGEPWD